MAWEVTNNLLRYISDAGEIHQFSATEIYKAFSMGCIDHLDVGSPNSIGLRASKISSSYILQIYCHDANLDLHLVINRNEGTYCYSGLIDDIPDSLVINGVWFNVSASRAEVLSLLNNAGITDLRSVSLTQYVNLIGLLADSSIKYLDFAKEVIQTEKAQTKEVTVSLKAELYDYQKKGFGWLSFMVRQKCGCILADEMGLGKTLQIIALIAHCSQQKRGHYLIVAPVSLLENWKREIDKFTEGLSVLVHHGPKRTGRYRDLLDYDITIISYNTASSDYSLLQMINWDFVVLDEAQNIKNPSSQRTRFVKMIPRTLGIAVTGTPFENHITDLWSIMDFVVPNCLGTLSDFEHRIADDDRGAIAIEPVLTPLMLRRKVNEVAQDLPERIDIPQPLRFNEIEAFEYEETRQAILSSFNGKNVALPLLQKLRMFCTHPSLVVDSNRWAVEPRSCTKFDRLLELLETIVSADEKTIVFTSYNGMFHIMRKHIEETFHIPTFIINGSTPTEMRQGLVDSFSTFDGAAVMLLNPRAAGTGLNITAATRVIHYNLEWNPSLEDQASARAYRRGQTRTVFVYRLFYEDSVEEIINERIEKKRDMFDNAIKGIDGSQENREDIVRALQLSPEVVSE